MILNSTGAGNLVVSQTALYTQIQANNGTVATYGNYYTSPFGLATTLGNIDRAHQYVPYSIANYNDATRTLAYDIDHFGIPAGALINAGAHWVNVYGISTNVQPVSGNNFTVNGFYVKDPWSGYKPGQGLGTNVYLANTAAGWQRVFTPTNYGGKYQGNYAFITDPDTTEMSTNCAPTPGTTSVASLTAAMSMAATDLAGISGLALDPSFENGAFSSTLGESTTLPGQTAADWLVPYNQNGNTTGVAFINSLTGDLDEAFWDEGVLRGDSLSAFEANLAQGPEGLVIDNIVPEPSTFALLGVGGVAFALRVFLKRRAIPNAVLRDRQSLPPVRACGLRWAGLRTTGSGPS